MNPENNDPNSAILIRIDGRARDLGDHFVVRRVLPFVHHRSVGPFVFFDHFGPTHIPAGSGMDVRPHPHIHLATITYLFDGQIFHRDSLGTQQVIGPGAVNWMTAGRGIVHSERTPDELRTTGFDVHGLQLWIALPTGLEDVEPTFQHHPAANIPETAQGGVSMRVLAGTAFGVSSPVQTLSTMVYAELTFQPGAELVIAADHPERALYVVEGSAMLDGETIVVGEMAVLRPGVTPVLRAEGPARVMLLGGEPLGPRHLWWNFVSSDLASIEKAKLDWREGRFPKVPGDDREFIPLPE